MYLPHLAYSVQKKLFRSCIKVNNCVFLFRFVHLTHMFIRCSKDLQKTQTATTECFSLIKIKNCGLFVCLFVFLFVCFVFCFVCLFVCILFCFVSCFDLFVCLFVWFFFLKVHCDKIMTS